MSDKLTLERLANGDVKVTCELENGSGDALLSKSPETAAIWLSYFVRPVSAHMIRTLAPRECHSLSKPNTPEPGGEA